jgi:3D (Asp-Asp-Asp) domain-containing protein
VTIISTSTITLLLTLTLLANPNEPTPPEIAAVPIGTTRSKAKLIPPMSKPAQAPPPQPAETYEIYEVTAYTAYEESTGKSPSHPAFGITASGKRVQAGKTAACPPSMPFGTRIEIEGVGERVCEDRGAAITEGRIDVYMPELNDALEFGRKRLKVRILKEESE